jgi:hypothetical protein
MNPYSTTKLRFAQQTVFAMRKALNLVMRIRVCVIVITHSLALTAVSASVDTCLTLILRTACLNASALQQAELSHAVVMANAMMIHSQTKLSVSVTLDLLMMEWRNVVSVWIQCSLILIVKSETGF